MITLDEVSKVVGRGRNKREILSGISLRIPTDRRIAVLGRSRQDMKIFVDLLAGVELPTSGNIVRNARVSFPVGHLGGFSNELSVRLNTIHAARLYGADVDAIVDFVEQVLKLGAAFDRPYGALRGGKRKEFSRVLAYSIPFDVYLLNEDIAPRGGKRNKDESFALFGARARSSGIIAVTRNLDFAREFCDMAIIMSGGGVKLINDMNSAIAAAGELLDNDPAVRRELRQNRRAKLEAAAAARRSKLDAAGRRESRQKGRAERESAAPGQVTDVERKARRELIRKRRAQRENRNR